MSSEGSHWYFAILSYNHIFTDWRFYRYIDYVLQGPAVLLLVISSKFSDYNTKKMAIYLLGFCWTFHPFLSLLAVRKILKNKGRQDLFVFPILSFATATISTMPLAVALALPAMSVFWPLFFMILLRNNKSYLELFFIFLLMIALVFTYEPSIIFFILFIIISIWDLYKTKKKHTYFNRAIVFSSLVSICWLLYVVYKVPIENSSAFLNSFLARLDAFRIFSFCSIFIIMSYLFLDLMLPKKQKTIFIISLFLYFLVLAWFLPVLSEFQVEQDIAFYISSFTAYDSRVTALPLTFLMAFLAFLFALRVKTSQWIFEFRGSRVIFFTSISVLMAVASDIKITYHWNQGYNRLEKYIKENTGCYNIAQSEYNNFYTESNLAHYAFQYTSILIQILNNIEPIRTLLFTNASWMPDESNRNACQNYTDNKFINNQGFALSTSGTQINYSKEIFKNTNSEQAK